METTKEQNAKAYENKKLRYSKITTVKFEENWNNKLYGTFFTSIRKHDSKINEGDLCDILINGKGVKLARCISAEVIKFHELTINSVQMDFGMEYRDALKKLNELGMQVSSFELLVKYCVFKTE
jgi:hypothetical protein